MSTNETTPRQIWLHEVLTVAKVSHDQAEHFRDMLNRWYNAGEPIWMAADSLKIIVKERDGVLRRQKYASQNSIHGAMKACALLLSDRKEEE